MTPTFRTIFEDNEISKALYLPEKDIIILGFETGQVKILNYLRTTNKITLLYEFQMLKKDRIVTISRFQNSSIVLIGTENAANLILFNVNDGKIQVIEEGNFSKYNRCFCSSWLSNENVLVGSTYGKLFFYRLNQNPINLENKDGHGTNPILSIDCRKGIEIISGDYRGYIGYWRNAENGLIQQEKIIGNPETIEGIAWQSAGNYFATLGQQGTIQIFKKIEFNGGFDWVLYIRFVSGTGYGKFITFSQDGTKVYAITHNKIIILDLNTTGVFVYSKPLGVYLYELQEKLLIITKYNILIAEIEQPVTTLYDTFSYVKIGVIGHTEAGKSTLCNAIINGGFYTPGIKSTEMKTIWDWEDAQTNSKKIIFHDFGGQRNIILAHLPQIIDSDIIIIVFSPRDVDTLDVAVDLRKKLISEYEYKKPFIFVQARSDEFDSIHRSLENFNEKNKDQLIEPIKTQWDVDKEGKAILDNNGRIKILNIDILKEKILSIVQKSSPKKQIVTIETKHLNDLIAQYQGEGREFVDFEEFFGKMNSKFLLYHKKEFLYALRSLVSQGRIELIENDHLIKVYLNMKKIARAKNEILQEIFTNNGLIIWDIFFSKINEMEKYSYRFALDILMKDRVCIIHQNIIIIIDFLKESVTEICMDFASKNGMNLSTSDLVVAYNVKKENVPEPYKWIPMFFELNLVIGVISKNNGFFYSQKKDEFCYIGFEKPANPFSPEYTLKAIIGGTSEDSKNDLKLKIEDFFLNFLG